MTPQDRYAAVHRRPKQCPDTGPDSLGDDFETLLEASTLASPTVERIRRRTPPVVCKRVQERLDQPQPAPDVGHVDHALLHLVRLCRMHRRPNPFAEILQSLLDHDALADVREDIAQQIISLTFAGATRPPPVAVDACLAVLDNGRIGDDLASRFATLLSPRDRAGGGAAAARSASWAPDPASAAEGAEEGPLAQVLTLRPPRPRRPQRPLLLYRGGQLDLGSVVGRSALANWCRRPERWLGAAACAAGTAAVGRVGWHWSRRRRAPRRWSRWWLREADGQRSATGS